MAKQHLTNRFKYAVYLESDAWRQFKQRYRESQMPQFCLACHAGNYGLHHINYDRLGFERLTDVVPLCWKCHKRLHEMRPKAGNTGLAGFRHHLREVFHLAPWHVNERMAAWSIVNDTKARNPKKARRQWSKTMRRKLEMQRDRDIHARMCDR